MERNLRLNWPAFVEEAIKRRKEQRLTQAQLAVLAGVSKPTLHRFEQGELNIRLDLVVRILNMLGMA